MSQVSALTTDTCKLSRFLNELLSDEATAVVLLIYSTRYDDCYSLNKFLISMIDSDISLSLYYPGPCVRRKLRTIQLNNAFTLRANLKKKNRILILVNYQPNRFFA